MSKTVFEIKHTMSHHELKSWAKYFQEEPHNSIEIQLAQISHQMGIFMGVKDRCLNDYLITEWKEKTEIETKVSEEQKLLQRWGFS